MPASEHLHARYEAHLPIRFELLQFLQDFAEAFDLQFKPRAFACLPLRKLTGARGRGVPLWEIRHVNDGAEYFGNRLFDDLSELYGRHSTEFPLQRTF